MAHCSRRPLSVHPLPQVGVLVNDLASVNIDGKLLSTHHSSTEASSTSTATPNLPPEILELSNGCICCNLKGDMVLVGEAAVTPPLGPIPRESSTHVPFHPQAIARLLVQFPDLRLLLVESTGVGEPLPVAAALQSLEVWTAQKCNSPPESVSPRSLWRSRLTAVLRQRGCLCLYLAM